jgi:hypothetical protein
MELGCGGVAGQVQGTVQNPTAFLTSPLNALCDTMPKCLLPAMCMYTPVTILGIHGKCAQQLVRDGVMSMCWTLMYFFTVHACTLIAANKNKKAILMVLI